MGAMNPDSVFPGGTRGGYIDGEVINGEVVDGEVVDGQVMPDRGAEPTRALPGGTVTRRTDI